MRGKTISSVGDNDFAGFSFIFFSFASHQNYLIYDLRYSIHLHNFILRKVSYPFFRGSLIFSDWLAWCAGRNLSGRSGANLYLLFLLFLPAIMIFLRWYLRMRCGSSEIERNLVGLRERERKASSLLKCYFYHPTLSAPFCPEIESWIFEFFRFLFFYFYVLLFSLSLAHISG